MTKKLLRYGHETANLRLSFKETNPASPDYNPQGQLVALYGPHPDQPAERMLLIGYTYDGLGNLTALTEA